jgi:hypothetical protein
VPAEPSAGAHVNEVLGSAGVWAAELRPEAISLEEVFLELTGEPGTMGAPPPPPPAAVAGKVR